MRASNTTSRGRGQEHSISHKSLQKSLIALCSMSNCQIRHRAAAERKDVLRCPEVLDFQEGETAYFT
ncbi:hypothetical protein Moror_4018 [Moniliophthora roreri MCA 2997]|uniref:Uncharacterized protein n=1 Tax=Moniliophthora roreri (strain MCA 2997) TaxID=1381753 RepID=V2XRV0_MONRO|nr:hypothetical protein Moror_4018 [Moniliophthora roreri MCA 2997]